MSDKDLKKKLKQVLKECREDSGDIFVDEVVIPRIIKIIKENK